MNMCCSSRQLTGSEGGARREPNLTRRLQSMAARGILHGHKGWSRNDKGRGCHCNPDDDEGNDVEEKRKRLRHLSRDGGKGLSTSFVSFLPTAVMY